LHRNTINQGAPASSSLVSIIDGQAKTNSLVVAEKFNKRHNNVLRAINNIDCSDEFRQLNFEHSTYKGVDGISVRMVEMTRDGFVFLVMGFTGKDAAHWKETYIAEFNRMEAALSASVPPPAVCPHQKPIPDSRVHRPRAEDCRGRGHRGSGGQ